MLGSFNALQKKQSPMRAMQSKDVGTLSSLLVAAGVAYSLVATAVGAWTIGAAVADKVFSLTQGRRAELEMQIATLEASLADARDQLSKLDEAEQVASELDSQSTE